MAGHRACRRERVTGRERECSGTRMTADLEKPRPTVFETALSSPVPEMREPKASQADAEWYERESSWITPPFSPVFILFYLFQLLMIFICIFFELLIKKNQMLHHQNQSISRMNQKNKQKVPFRSLCCGGSRVSRRARVKPWRSNSESFVSKYRTVECAANTSSVEEISGTRSSMAGRTTPSQKSFSGVTSAASLAASSAPCQKKKEKGKKRKKIKYY